MKLFKTTFLNIPVLAWLLSFIAAATMPVILFYLFFSPVLGFAILLVLLAGGWFLKNNPSAEEDQEHHLFDWINEALFLLTPFFYLWIFTDRGFWALSLYLIITVLYTYEFASIFRATPTEPEIAPSDKPWYH